MTHDTLRLLSEHHGARIDDFRDEEPGRILHELRLGEMTAPEERPHSPYFGSSDSTPLFLILVERLLRQRALPVVKVRRKLLVRRSAVESWLAAQETPEKMSGQARCGPALPHDLREPVLGQEALIRHHSRCL
jgi:hypothetical protein